MIKSGEIACTHCTWEFSEISASIIVFWVLNGSLEQWLQTEKDIIAGDQKDALRLPFLDFETYMSDSGLHGEKPGFDCFTESALGLERLN
eukprot:5519777-Pyramimonas_sp.AAC.1